MALIEPELSLALSLSNNPGIYVPLIGSGVSRSSGIMSGWDITVDLVRQLASLMGEDCEPHPEKWFVKKFNKEPMYSELLEELGKTPGERQGILRKYFEPTEEEREQNEKTPKQAHKAIAVLVKHGFVRLILTTNFDRLMERACEDEGIVPTVISKSSDIAGAKPFHQTGCTIVKVNGDYLDSRIKNSESELSEYDPQMNEFLDRIFDEHGLIISGWSAQWDNALRDAILRSKSRRYQTYWVKTGSVTIEAEKVINNRQAVIVESTGADAFFNKIKEHVASLSDSIRPHPLSIKTAVATVKRLLPDEKNEIRINDLFLDEVKAVFQLISKKDPEQEPKQYSKFKIYEDYTEKLRAMLVTAVQWDKGLYTSLWLRLLDHFAKPLREYPSILMIYTVGLTCTSLGKYKMLASILKNAKCRTLRNEGPLIRSTYPHKYRDQLNRERNDNQNLYTPLNDYLFELIKDLVLPLAHTKEDYDLAFKEFEYLYGLTCAYFDKASEVRLRESAWGPPGRFVWQETHRFGNEDVKMSEAIFGDKLGLVGEQFIATGLFDGTLDKFMEIVKEYDALQLRIRYEWR